MRHIIEHDQKPYSPVPNFSASSKLLVGMITIAYPIITLFCLKIASALTETTTQTFKSLALVYPEGSSLGYLHFEQLAESKTMFTWYTLLLMLLVSLLAGIFEVFRIRNFWINFIISAILLYIGLAIFGPNLSSLTSY
jgi:hypothetical protein